MRWRASINKCVAKYGRYSVESGVFGRRDGLVVSVES